MNYLLITSGISFLGTSFILLRRVHENRIAGVSGEHVFDAYWPFNVMWGYVCKTVKNLLNRIYSFARPHFEHIVGTVASKMYMITSAISHQFLQLSNLIHGKGFVKKNTGTTSLFIRDISEYKRSGRTK